MLCCAAFRKRCRPAASCVRLKLRAASCPIEMPTGRKPKTAPGGGGRQPEGGLVSNIDSGQLTMSHIMNIYVGNLPLELTEDELRKEFSAFGQVKSINLIKERYAGSLQPRLYGFVEMDSRTEGEAAVLSLRGKEIGGRVIEVISALPLSNDKERLSFNRRRGRPHHKLQGHQA